MSNAELSTEARGIRNWAQHETGPEGEGRTGPTLFARLVYALEAAEAALSAEKRDAALAEKHWHRDKADLDFIAAQRDAALAVIAEADARALNLRQSDRHAASLAMDIHAILKATK